MRNLEKLEYDIEVVTPMFLGGADKNAELRIPSIKGMLRFWWRVTCEFTDIKKMKEKEEEIFGSTENKSKVIIRLKHGNIKFSKDIFKGKIIKDIISLRDKNCKYIYDKNGKIKKKEIEIDILHYLAYGVVVWEKNLKENVVDREYIPEGCSFRIVIYTPYRYKQEIERAMKYFINFGGLGSKSRNGFGSLYCEKLTDNNIRTTFSNIPLRDFTSFSKESKIIKFSTHSTWQDALSEAGKIYREARLSLEPRHCFNNRGLISRPIEARCENIPSYIKNERHAKPYFIHVNKISNVEYQSQILFLPYFYKSDKAQFKDYLRVTEQMNKQIEKISGKTWE